MDWRDNVTDPDELRAAFAGSPQAQYRPIAAWWWSGERVEEERLFWQLDRLHEMGCGGFAYTGLAMHGPAAGTQADDPEVLSPRWWDLFRRCCERAREFGMGAVSWSPLQIGLPVDSPKLIRDHPELRGQRIALTEDGRARPLPFGVDFGNPAAIEALVAPGTEAGGYLDGAADLLGDVMVAMFEDEIPAFPRWAPDFVDTFRTLKGYDPVPEALETDIGPTTPAMRWSLLDVATTRVEQAYTRFLADWTQRHGLLAGFDEMSRGGTPLLTIAYYLDPFRTLAWANAPGTDQMGDARFHLSLADIGGHHRVWLEGFHSHGWGMRLSDQARLLFEWGREGANLFLPHGIYYSNRALWWEWASPEMGFKQPYARHYPAFAEMVGRLCLALSAGRHRPEVAVLYPTSTVWAASTGYLRWGPEAIEAERAYLQLMGRHHVPSGIDLERAAHPSLLADAGYDRITVDERHIDSFDVPIVVAACRCLTTAAVETLIAAAERGRTVVLVEPLPQWSAEGGRDDPGFAKLVTRLTEVATVVAAVTDVPAALPPPRAQGLKAQWRTVGDLDLLCVTGAGKLRLPGCADRRPELWDPRTGGIRPLPARVDGDALVVELDGPLALLALPPGTPEPPAPVRYRELELPEVWECEYLPWGENRWGDYRLPANPGTPPAERRTFAHREGDDPGWAQAPVTPEDVAHPITELGFEDRMRGEMGRPRPADRILGGGWREVVSTYGPKATVDGQLAEYSERLGVEDMVPSTPIGLKGKVETAKVDLAERGGTIVSYGLVPEECDTHLVVEGGGVFTISVDGEQVAGPLEGGVISVPVHLRPGWHKVELHIEYRGVAGREYFYLRPPQTRVSWSFTDPYRRPSGGIWGGGMLMHPDQKGNPGPIDLLRRVVVPAETEVEVHFDAPGGVTHDIPARLPAGEHLLEVTAGEAVDRVGLSARIVLRTGTAESVIGADERWEVRNPDGDWEGALLLSGSGAISWDEAGDAPAEPRRHPLLDVAWLEGEDVLAGHVETAWADDPGPPPPAWFCFTAAPGARSITLPVVGEVTAYVDGNATPVTSGRLPLREHARVAVRVQPPAGYRGAACFTEHPLLALGPGTIRTGTSWHRQGLDVFSGVILHRAHVEVGEGCDAVLDLGEVSGSVRCFVNGEDAGTLFVAPWRLDVHLRAGSNTIELEVANTLGPMAARGVPTPFGPEDQRDSGLLRRPRLLVRQ
jgi:hypothetical protein